MNTTEKEKIKLVISYLESFIETEETISAECNLCLNQSMKAKEIIDFDEAKTALKILKQIEINTL